MMKFTEFCSEIAGQVQRKLGDGYSTELRTVRKNNNVTMEGILIRYQDANVVPTVYLDPFYEQYCEGRLPQHITEEILEVYRNNKVPWKEEPSFEYAGIKDRILFRLMNLPLNREELEHMPHVEIGDFAVGFQWTVDTGDSRIGTVRVTDDQATAWGVSAADLTEMALHNAARCAPPVLRSIEDVLLDILGKDGSAGGTEEERESFCESLRDEASRKEFPMYVLSNPNAHMGASALLALPFLGRFREEIGEDFWILPSSIHEVILVPLSKVAERDKLEAMVREINKTQVPPQEFLSDEVYRFSEFEELMPRDFREQLLQAG